MSEKFQNLISHVRSLYGASGFIPLHAPLFGGNERSYLMECMDSTFVSSVGPFVDKFEKMIAEITGAKFAVATVNGTAGLHMALIVTGIRPGDEVITQALSFAATANAIAYQFAHPIFIDVDQKTLGMSADALERFLTTRCERKGRECWNKKTGRRVGAVVPMHTFGFPVEIERISSICQEWNLPLVEDAAESLGSYSGNKHTGTFGVCGTFSFNGNKTVTCGGGGCIVTDDENVAKRAKHLTTTAKRPHRWEFFHDEVGYNYRMPNLNAALACAQLEQLPDFLKSKRDTSKSYNEFCGKNNISYLDEPLNCTANFWLNAIVLKDKEERDALLEMASNQDIMMRPIWNLLNTLPAFSRCETDSLKNSKYLEERIVNLPSSVRPIK